MINDVRGLRLPGALTAVAASRAAACVMHMQGTPRTMQKNPHYDDVVTEVAAFLDARLGACVAAGIARTRLCVDPGLGFGKNLAHNLALMRGLNTFARFNVPLLFGVSRKAMFARLFACDDLDSRINGSLAAAFWASQQGARIIRVHDVRATQQVLTFARMLRLRQ
jgi:dihydropteroate synthase